MALKYEGKVWKIFENTPYSRMQSTGNFIREFPETCG